LILCFIRSATDAAQSVTGWVISDVLQSHSSNSPATAAITDASGPGTEACDVELVADAQLPGAHILRVSAAAGASRSAVAAGRVFVQFPDPTMGLSLDVPLPLLVLIMRADAGFCAVEAAVATSAGPRTVTVSTRQSAVRVKATAVSAPLSLCDNGEWGVAVVDLAYLVAQAFVQPTSTPTGTAASTVVTGLRAPAPARYVHCERVRIHPDCRVAAVYFAAQAEAFDRLPAVVRAQCAALAPSSAQHGHNQQHNQQQQQGVWAPQ